MSGRRRGFTLIELLCYLALLTGGTMVIAGLEYTASRAAFLERGLVELGLAGDALGTQFRDDVRQATAVEGPAVEPGTRPRGTLLVVKLPSGSEVRYDIDSADKLVLLPGPGGDLRGERVRLVRRFHPAPGAPARGETVTSVEALHLSRETGAAATTWRLEVTLAYSRGGETTARRRYVFGAAQVAEGSP